MDLYPAIDIRNGRAVRLTQGDFDLQTEYGDPVDLAVRFAAAGAPWLHVVDLDAARAGHPVNRATVLAIAAAVGVPVESGGGVRSEADVDELLDGGVARVILGTLALDDPDLVRAMAGAHPGRLAVGIDYRIGADGQTEVAVRGWEQGSGRTVGDVLDELEDAGVAAVIVTSIERDGMLNGPDLLGLQTVLGRTTIPVIASGGVGTVADVAALAVLAVPDPAAVPDAVPGAVPDAVRDHDLDAKDNRAVRRLAGVITGKALVDGRMTVEEGVAACARSE